MNVSVRELKSHLPELRNRAAAGERITVTKRGKPIATVSAASAEHGDDPIDRLERATVLRSQSDRGALSAWTIPRT